MSYTNKYNLTLIITAFYGALLLTISSPAQSRDNKPDAQIDCNCEKRIEIRGDVSRATYDGAKVKGATSSEYYHKEVYGKEFSAIIPGLPEGDYEITVYIAETYFNVPNARVFSILSGSTMIAENLDIYSSAGSFREHVLKKVIHHHEDALGGPLEIEFRASKNSAKFNAIIIKGTEGNTVASLHASDVLGSDEWAEHIPEVSGPRLYLDTSLPFETRSKDLIRRMSLKEKVSQLMDSAPAIERLGLPGYGYWNECLHGVGRAGHATVFPQAIGLAATWDTELIHRVANTIATEARAKNNDARKSSPSTRRYYGLTFWTPNINIFRDPRWGRGQETYGEDPYLTGELAVAFIKGLQGDHPKYYKAMACAKHFAVHSGPEKLRHTFNATVSERDLYETYLPHFEAAVKQGGVGSVMSVYNAFEGVPGPASDFLLTDILRDRWGFQGHVVSDCGAVHDIWKNHNYAETPAEASALAIKAGNDLNCGGTYGALVSAVRKGLVSEEDLDLALKRVLMARFQLGLFDSPQECEYLSIPISENDSHKNSQVALEASRNSMVLLKNDGTLPLNSSQIKSIAVIGPNANSVNALIGNYSGKPSHPITILEGIREHVGKQITINYSHGCPLAIKEGETFTIDNKQAQEALLLAKRSDLVVFVGGYDATLEGEEMRSSFVGFDGGDRISIRLPKPQRKLLAALSDLDRPIVMVNLSGSAVAFREEAKEVSSILQAWYPGQNGGKAVAEILFGKANPAGRLPVTFYQSIDDLPDFSNYSMKGRTYKYFKGKPLYPFGHGLSYTTFEYNSLQLSSETMSQTKQCNVSIAVTNSGNRTGEEVVQLYIQPQGLSSSDPIHVLKGFKRIELKPGETAKVEFELPASSFRRWNTAIGDYEVKAGKYLIQVGSSSSDIRKEGLLEILEPN